MDGKTRINKVYDPTCGVEATFTDEKQFDEHIIEQGFWSRNQHDKFYLSSYEYVSS